MSDPGGLEPWSVTAVNLADHAENPIHTDAGAQAAGFPRALVAGVTTYAYLTHVPATAWGVRWLESGWAHLKLRRPVFDGSEVQLIPTGSTVSAVVDDEAKATIDVGIGSAPTLLPPAEAALLDGEHTIPIEVDLGPDGAWWRYGQRAGDTIDLYDSLGIVHPGVWPSLANHLFHTQIVHGSWIHTESIIVHAATVPASGTALIEGSIVERGRTSLGATATADIRIVVDEQVVARLRHLALVDLTPHEREPSTT